jgi:hypothetical protein
MISDEELTDALAMSAKLTTQEEREKPMNVRSIPEQPKDMNRSVVAATNEDTARATRKMSEQMDNVVGNLDREIAEAEAVRMTVIRRISDLNLTRQACIAAKEVLK